MQINSKFRIFGLIIGVLVLAGLVGVMVLTVQRAQQLTSTITRPKAAGTGACTGTTATDVGFCGGGGCQGNCACGCPVKDSSGNWSGSNCKPPSSSYSCQYTPVDIRCYTRVPADCGQFTSQAVCVSYPGCSWGTVSNLAASYPINDRVVDSLTPTFSWAGDSSGVSYQVLCVGSYADGHPPGSCNFVNCTKDFGPNDRSYALTTPLSPNTDYRWLVYWQPGNPAPTTGCQSFRTGAAPVTYYGCVNKTCAAVSGATANANGCTATGGACCAGASDCATGQTCDTTKAPNSCISSCGGSTPDFCGSACTNKQTDINNCGACGNVCNATHGTATCSSSACGITCSSGYGNCDSNAANGCEVSLNTTSNCGACGNVCSSGQNCDTSKSPSQCVTQKVVCDSLTVSPASGNAPLSVVETLVGHTVNGGSITGYKFVNESKTATQSATTFNYTFNNPGTATVSGYVVDNNGNADGGSGACVVTVSAACINDSQCPSGQICKSGSCSVPDEVNICWGNGGTGTNAGRCYDCNGDGTVNILDFSCFRLNWLKPVQ